MYESNTSIRDFNENDNVATPHEVVSGKLQPINYDNVDAVGPAGAINSNVIDMTKWMRLNLDGGVFNGEEILSPAVIREMQSIQTKNQVP